MASSHEKYTSIYHRPKNQNVKLDLQMVYIPMNFRYIIIY